MIRLKSREEIEKLRIGGQKLATVIKKTAEKVAPGVLASELNDFAHKMIIDLGCQPSFLNYKPAGAKRAFPASICLSINDEIVHGIPNETKKEIKEGDIVKVDIGLIYEGLYTDSAVTVAVGKVSKEAKILVKKTKEALSAAIKQCKVGNHIGDIGRAVEQVANSAGLTVINELTGHGVGYSVHEDPYVPNTSKTGQRDMLEEGLVIAIEPMFSLGSGNIIVAKDGHTYKTKDGSLSAQFEHTVAITADGPIILTEL